jgi:hypothetical protein
MAILREAGCMAATGRQQTGNSAPQRVRQVRNAPAGASAARAKAARGVVDEVPLFHRFCTCVASAA